MQKTPLSNLLRRAAVVASILIVSGCGLGKKSVLFVTKTSFGVDIDTKPPTLDISYTRKEGTLSPEFEGGVLPQMASFTSQVGFPINVAVGQSIATGSAALILSKYLGTDVGPKKDQEVDPALLADERATAISGSTANARRYFFGTDTSFGLRVTFNLETGGYPDSLNLGYKRKEIAYLPISEDISEKKVSLPSLLATAGLDADVRSTRATRTVYNQFFATGASARYLAASPSVRNTIGRRIVKDSELAIELDRTQKDVELVDEAERLTAMVDTIADDDIRALCRNPPVPDSAALAPLVQGVDCSKAALAREATRRRISMVEDRETNLPKWRAALEAARKKP